MKNDIYVDLTGENVVEVICISSESNEDDIWPSEIEVVSVSSDSNEDNLPESVIEVVTLSSDSEEDIFSPTLVRKRKWNNIKMGHTVIFQKLAKLEKQLKDLEE